MALAAWYRSLAFFMGSTCVTEMVIVVVFISAVCAFTEGIEDIAGTAASLLTALSFLGSSFTSLLVVAYCIPVVPFSFFWP